MISGGSNGMWMFVLWASIFLIVAMLAGPIAGLFVAAGLLGEVAAAIVGSIIAILLGTAAGIGGTILIKKYFHEDYEINTSTTGINVLAQITIGVGIACLGLAELAALPFILGCLMLYSAAALLDFLVFNYTYAPLKRRYIC